MHFLEWVRQPGNKLIITDNIKNANAVVRNANRKAGLDIFQLNCMRIQELALELVTAHRAQRNSMKPIRLLQPEAGIYMLDSLLNEKQYEFLPKECYCIKTTKAIYQSMQQIRMNHATEAFEAAGTGKVADLKAMISCYEERIQKEGYLDVVLVLREACQLLGGLQNKDELLLLLPWMKEISLADFADMEYTALEADFLHSLFTILEQEKLSLEYYVQGEKKPQVAYRFFKAYGIVNEVQYVVKQILEQKLPLGEVNVFYTGEEYEPFIKGLFGKHNISYRFLTRESLQENKLMLFVQGVLRFAEEDFLYERLAEVVENPWMTFGNVLDKEAMEEKKYYTSARRCYDQFLKRGIGWGKERYEACIQREEQDEESTQKYRLYLDFLQDLLKVFETEKSCGAVYGSLLEFAAKYTHKCEERNRTLAILKEQLEILEQIEPQDSLQKTISLIREYLQDMETKQAVETDAVSVIHLQKQEVLEREYNFLIGLSAKQFMADMSESPILSDEELKLYLVGKVELAKEAGDRVRENLLRTLATLETGMIYMGYSTYDTIELKEGSPSVFYLDCLELWGEPAEETGEEQVENTDEEIHKKKVESQSFAILKGPLYMPELQVAEAIGEQQVDEEDEKESNVSDIEDAEDGQQELLGEAKDVIVKPTADGQEVLQETADNRLICKMSPSALHILMECPLRYYYHYRKGLAEREFLKKNASEWLSPAKKGDLFHHTLEHYCKEVLMQPGINATADRVVFDRVFAQEVEKILMEQPYVSQTVFEQEKQEAMDCCWSYISDLQKELFNAAQSAQQWKILGCESSFEALDYEVAGRENEEDSIFIQFKGTIDRLDGYVDGNGTLHLRIIDYKTGNFKKFGEELEKQKKLQHFIYAGAALVMAASKKEDFEALLQKSYTEAIIDEVRYDFPYEGEALGCTKAEEKKFVLPIEVEQRIVGCVKPWLLGEDDAAYAYMESTQGIFSAEMKQCRYCTYGRICRKKLDM